MQGNRTVYAWTLPLIVVAFVVDRITKWWATQRLAPDTIELIPGWFDFTYVPNPNIVFFFNLPVWVMLVIVSLVSVLLLFVAAYEYRTGNHWNVVLLALILAGAFSNALDRVQVGVVIDFLRIPFWTIFNLADIYVIAGAIGIVLRSYRSTKNLEDQTLQAAQKSQKSESTHKV